MKAWFEGLAPRERILVMAAATLLVLLLLFALVWSPIHSGYSALKSGVAEQRDTAAWMQASAQKIRQLKRSAGPSAGLGGRSLLALTDSTARAAGLGPALKRVEPEGSNNVRVWLDGASFDVLVKWMGTLSTAHGIHADSVTMERGGAAGRVNARLTLQATNQ